MATFNLEVSLDGAAFEDSSELSRILQILSYRVQTQVIDGEVTLNDAFSHTALNTIYDINGNAVGRFGIEEES